MTATQRMRNLLALAQARECARPVPTERLVLLAVAAGWARRDAEAALADLARQGFAQQTAPGWTLRWAAVVPRVCADHGRNVRLVR
jgi:hypothetical protein